MSDESEYQFTAAVDAIFTEAEVIDYYENRERAVVSFRLDSLGGTGLIDGITFAELERLSALLGTDRIGFRDGEVVGGCPTCEWRILPLIYADGVRFSTEP